MKEPNHNGGRDRPRVVVVEDERLQAVALQRLLELNGYRVTVCEDGASALAHADEDTELILCDLRLPDMDGLEIHRRVNEALGGRAPAVVIMTAYGTVDSAREALKAGVYDYLTKPIDPTDLTHLVDMVLEQRRLRRENEALSLEVAPLSLEERLIGESESFRATVELATNAGRSAATILIQGESGTGKELIAELIHAASPRAEGPFVKVNCGAIPEALLEAELFGHEVGAFTDARRARKGRFELADGGTIFLDEIGEMSPSLQVKLLHVLQERQLERLGGQGQAVPLDIRLVAATNRDLDAMVKDGSFREDLYYRINVITIEVPPLRERPSDVALLAEHFCRRFTLRNHKRFRGLSPGALAYLRERDWPGNVRELENVIERAVVLGQGEWLESEHLRDLGDEGASDEGAPSEDLVDQLLECNLSLEDMERELISQALGRAQGNVSGAARILGLTRRTLQYRMEKYGVDNGAGNGA